MAKQVIVSKRFARGLDNLLHYLQEEWSQKVAIEFSRKIEDRIEYIAKYPETGMPSKKKGIRSIIVGKHSRIYYSFDATTIKILLLRDMQRNPKNNPY